MSERGKHEDARVVGWRGFLQRLGWFVALWVLGVLSLAAVGALVKLTFKL